MNIKKTAKWGIGILLTPILLFIILAILLYIPPIQNWMVRQVASVASEKTGLDISVGHVSLAFPLDLSVEHFKMIQPNDSMPQVKDTVADVKRLVVNIQLLPLLKQRVVVNKLDFNQLKLNTTNFVHEARIKGNVGRLYVKSDAIDWGKQLVNVNNALLKDARVNVELSDTVPPDTTKTPTYWKIKVDKLNIARANVTVHMPGDTLQVAATLGNFNARGGFFDLYKNLYKLKQLDWTEGCIAYDNNFKVHTKGLDVNHIALKQVTVGIDSFQFCQPKLSMNLRKCSFKEKSGISIDSLSSRISLDSTKIWLPNLKLYTPNSQLAAHVAMDLNVMDETAPGKLHLTANASIGKQDIMKLLGGMPTSFIRKWPNRPLTVETVLTGNMKMARFAGLVVNLPTAFKLTAKGYAARLNNMNKLKADIDMNVKTYRLDFVNALLAGSSVRIPQGIGIKGNVKVNGKQYDAHLLATQGGGKLKADAHINVAKMVYKANMEAQNLKLNQFVPDNGLGDFSGYIALNGAGTNLLSPSMRLEAKAAVSHFSFDKYNLNGMELAAHIGQGKANMSMTSNNPLLKGMVTINALLNRKLLKASLLADVEHADWQQLHIAKAPLSTALTGQVDLETDLKTSIAVNGIVKDIAIIDTGKVYHPDNLTMELYSRADTTHVAARCGDFHLLFNGSGGYKKVMAKSQHFVNELICELKNKHIDIVELHRQLPLAQLNLATGKENPFSRFLARQGYTFKEATIDMTSSPRSGLNGDVELIALQNASIRLDTIRFNVASDSTHCTYDAQVRNGKTNPQYVFNALIDGYVFEKGSGMNVQFYDAKNVLGLKLGIEASLEEDGFKLHLLDDDPILGYKKFEVNKDNYIYMKSNKRISADLKLKADDGMGVHVYTDDDDDVAFQNLTVALNRFELEKILSVIPYMPDIKGTMNGDFHLIQKPEEMSVSSSLSIDNMVYEGVKMGNISTEFVYMPQADGTHYVDGMLMCNDDKVANITGNYNSEGQGNLDATLTLEHTPLRLFNGFMPDGILAFTGYADGTLSVKGPLSRPDANGELTLDSCYMKSAQYGISLKADKGPLRIVGSHLLFENFNLAANNSNKLKVNGDLDFSHTDNMQLNMSMMANDFQLINAKENSHSVAYGKAYVDFLARINGPVNNLNMQGRINVLGSTDMAYILRDSPLTTDNQMDELVKFTSFADTANTVVKHEPISGFNMDLSLNIDRGAHIICYLNDSHSNYIDLIGGGNLRMRYNAADELSLTGKYTLDNGEMKYSLPVIPLKTFTIQDGSYIEFTGDPMNPKLNITATERTKATVSQGSSGQGRTVEFDCGVIITKTLSDMGLEFTLDTPEDMSIHNELQAMGAGQRGKLAVTMLTTGMYLADGNTSGFSMNNALSSFLQSEINNITGTALKTLDLSFGLDNSTDASGNTHTDYSFKFAKRFWNNRLRIVVGGKVSTGADVTNQNESFFDNVTFEYRLGSSSEKYVKLFYDNNAYDWLEGTTREFGVGLIWRRSLQHFKDIFSFKKTKNNAAVPTDSTVQKSKDAAK